jgi:23S rRNA (uracil1939-C5)-methyltransferase
MEKIVEITRISLLGQGVGSDSEGNIYFVPRALPGDTVKVSIVSQDKKYYECDLVEVITPSPERVASPCDYFHQCGGCDWLHWNYSDQLKGKQKMIEHAMERTTLSPNKILPIIGAERPLHYRNRIQLRAGQGRLGFFKKKSHELVDIEKCQIAQPSLNEAIAKIRKSGLSSGAQIEKIELYLTEKGEVRQVSNEAHGAEGFRQINEEQNKLLQNCVANYVKQAKSKKVLELYCGNGNLTFAYQDRVEKIIAIDANEAAIAQAKKTRELLGIDAANSSMAFICDSVNRGTARKLPAEFKGHYDTLIIDPPRSGLAGILGQLVHNQLKHIIYISCSVQSFSQDVQCLKDQFHFEELQPIDMFPQTRHIEFVGKFSRI